MSRPLVLAGLLSLACPLAAHAQSGPPAERTAVPQVLAHYGRLLGANDQPVNATVAMRFELHTTDNPNLHQPKWSDTRQVIVADGHYGTLLGDTRSGGKALDMTLLAEPELYVSVTIDGNEMLPRLRIPSVPFALRTERAAVAEQVLANGVDTVAVQDGAITLAKLQRTNGKMVGLDADTLDGLDASAFAPAAIQTQIDAIAQSVGTGLFDKLAATQALLGTPANGATLADGLQQANDGLAQLATAVAGVKSALGTPQTSLTDAASAIKADTAAIRTDTGTLKGDTTTLKSDTTTLKSDTTTLKSDTTTLKSDTASLKSDTSTLKSDTAALKAALGTMASGRSISATVAAAARYSQTCNPATDAFLRDAYPGLTDAQVTDACFRDGRWHQWGSALDLVMGTKSLPPGFEVGITNYSQMIQRAQVNGWNYGTRFCYGPTAVGDVNTPSGSGLVVECISAIVPRDLSSRSFFVTHEFVDNGTVTSSQRTYTSYDVTKPSTETSTPCTVTGSGATNCGNTESYATFWQIWLRQ